MQSTSKALVGWFAGSAEIKMPPVMISPEIHQPSVELAAVIPHDPWCVMFGSQRRAVLLLDGGRSIASASRL